MYVNSLPNKHEWLTNFLKTEKFKRLKSFIENIDGIRLRKYKHEWVNNFTKSDKFKSYQEFVDSLDGTIRYKFDDYLIFGAREAEVKHYTVDLQPFYILDYITTNNDELIYDIGCGINLFSRFYNVVGIDYGHPNADIVDTFDVNFCDKNKNAFENAISINGIHFCSIFEIEERIKNYFDLVKPGGYAYLAINTGRLYFLPQLF